MTDSNPSQLGVSSLCRSPQIPSPVIGGDAAVYTQVGRPFPNPCPMPRGVGERSELTVQGSGDALPASLSAGFSQWQRIEDRKSFFEKLLRLLLAKLAAFVLRLSKLIKNECQ